MPSDGRRVRPSVLLIREWEQQMSSSGCCGRLEGDFLAPRGERCFPERRSVMEAMGPLYRDLRSQYGDEVEINVVEQCLNIFKTGVVQRRRLNTFCDPASEYTQPRIHAMVYDVADGILKELDVNWEEKIAELRNIYDLYDFDAEGCKVVYPDKTSGPMPASI